MSQNGAASLERIDSTNLPPPAEVPSKTKIAERLSKAVDAAAPEKNKNRSPELIPLTAEYEAMKKKLRRLIVVVKAYAESTAKMNSTRDELVEHLALMSQKSPIHDPVGCELDGEATETLETVRQSPGGKTVEQVGTEWRSRHNADVCSLAGVQRLASVQAVVNAREYHEHIVEYVVEWEKVVTERVDMELKNVRKLQADRTHYERKVESLRQRANELESKGKNSPAAQVEKLVRNETKLKHAYMVHESDAGRLCVLIEAATRDGWKDLYHLVKNYIKWESNRVGRESDIYCQMSETLTSMKSHFKNNSKKSSSSK